MTMASEDSYTFTCIDVPYLQIVKINPRVRFGNSTDSTCGVVTTTDNFIATYIETSYTRGVPVKYTEHDSLLDIPYTESRISRACHCDRAVMQYSGASDGCGMPAKDVNAMSKHP
jgi:hypothetical protein